MALGHLPNSVAAKPARDAFVVVQRATAADLLREPWMESPCNKVTLLPLIEAVETARRQRGAPMRPVLPAYVGGVRPYVRVRVGGVRLLTECRRAVGLGGRGRVRVQQRTRVRGRQLRSRPCQGEGRRAW